MPSNSPEAVLAKIGARIAQMGERGSSRYFLYLETEEGMQSPILLQEFEDHAQDMVAEGVLEMLYELWLDAEPRWGALQYELDGDRFSAKFDYDIDPTDDHTDQRTQAAIKARFGAKPIVYLTHDEFVIQHASQSKIFD